MAQTNNHISNILALKTNRVVQQNVITDVSSLQSEINDLYNQVTIGFQDLDNHVSDTSNPHSVTKAQVGLGNVDNTSDANKPISTATQTAIDAINNKFNGGYNGHFVVMTSSTTFVTLYFTDGLLTSVV